jgi:hypothetical protein
MAIAISRSVTQSTTTAGTFQALSALGAATVSSSFTVPTNVSSIKNLTVSFSVDAVEEFCGLVKITGNAMRDGDAVFNCGGFGSTTRKLCFFRNCNYFSSYYRLRNNRTIRLGA